MADKIISEMDDRADFFNSIDLIIYPIQAKYNIKSFIANRLSYDYPAKTIIVMQDINPNRVWFSARRQDFKVKMNELLEEAVKGIPDSSAGGHIPAAAGSIPKNYAEKFKENLVKILKEGE
jgi:single-stranded DNA-specific DHH superfamily exonuclease